MHDITVSKRTEVRAPMEGEVKIKLALDKKQNCLFLYSWCRHSACSVPRTVHNMGDAGDVTMWGNRGEH